MQFIYQPQKQQTPLHPQLESDDPYQEKEYKINNMTPLEYLEKHFVQLQAVRNDSLGQKQETADLQLYSDLNCQCFASFNFWHKNLQSPEVH